MLLDDPVDKKSGDSNHGTSFVRIGSIDLSGNVIAKVKSRPLKKNLAEVTFALDTFDPLDDQIKIHSLEKLAKTGRRGCTTDELYTMIQSYIGGILKQVLADTVEDVAVGGGKTRDKVESVVNVTKKSISKYINDASEWSGGQVQDKLAERLKKWGVTTNKVKSRQAISMIAKELLQSSDMGLSTGQRLQYIYKNILKEEQVSGDEENIGSAPDKK